MDIFELISRIHAIAVLLDISPIKLLHVFPEVE